MSEQSEKKSPARAAAMAKVWAGRRAWGMAPTCCCGCDQRLEIAKTPERQKYFKPGHDTALKSLLRKVLSGSVPREKIPEAARANLARINPFSANRCSSSTILGSPTLQPLQLDSRNRKKRV